MIVKAFIDKYNYYPGDIPNASDMFGITGTDGDGLYMTVIMERVTKHGII